MSARTVAERLTADPVIQAKVENELSGSTDAEAERVLELVDHAMEHVGIDAEGATLVRLVETARDRVAGARVNGSPSLDTSTEMPRWTPLDFEGIERDGIPPIDWLFPQWVAAGDIFLVAGDAGVGKSTLASRLAYAAASGCEWCGIAATRKIRVLYLDEEQSEAEVYRLFRKHGPPLPKSDLRVFVGQGANLDSDAGLAALEREIADFTPDLIVIDSATAAFGKTEGNSNAEVGAVFRRLFHLRSTYNLTIGFLHHLGKQGEVKRNLLHRVLGSVAFGSQASAVFGVLPHDADSIELHQAKRRQASRPYPTMIVAYHEEGDLAHLENRGPVEDTQGQVLRAAEWVTQFLSDRGTPTKREDILKAGAAVPPTEGPHSAKSIEHALNHLLKLGTISRPKRGWYARTEVTS